MMLMVRCASAVVKGSSHTPAVPHSTPESPPVKLGTSPLPGAKAAKTGDIKPSDSGGAVRARVLDGTGFGVVAGPGSSPGQASRMAICQLLHLRKMKATTREQYNANRKECESRGTLTRMKRDLLTKGRFKV